jgi:hypothetical protein
MDANSVDRRLLWMRRMIWWLPALVFAVFAAFYVGTNPLTGGTVIGAILNALIPAIIVGILCLAVYFGYRYYLTRNPSA